MFKKLLGLFGRKEQSIGELLLGKINKVIHADPQKIMDRNGRLIATVERDTYVTPKGEVNIRTYNVEEANPLRSIIRQIQKAIGPKGQIEYSYLTNERELISRSELASRIAKFKQPARVAITNPKPYELPRGYDSLCVR